MNQTGRVPKLMHQHAQEVDTRGGLAACGVQQVHPGDILGVVARRRVDKPAVPGRIEVNQDHSVPVRAELQPWQISDSHGDRAQRQPLRWIELHPLQGGAHQSL